ncbi:unnamed protein product [[Actinomadura] parvosata subsp. kistnae]|uniref:Uncharacterized protein n=2 Tax=Nonomuraea TaxID=83681 RepID=A0A1V0AE48_9ACTN|nr:hypothetical protein [Nonomuraea sp. ATCC 55076]AQZ68487.1 hypothetical protein BKM31_49735 [Nonomuraea sp. ATCC 55076]SPL93057.1 unnamed protein product [Actinomadura parvosata subsp. kistnae]
MRKTLATAALAGSMAVTALALSPAVAHAATPTATTTTAASTVTVVKWGKFFSSDRKAYTYGKTWASHGKVFTKWYGVDRPGGKKGWVWFEYYQNGSWHKFNKSWDGEVVGAWSGKGIKKVYTFTCWAGKFDNCGKKYRIY